MSVPAKRLPIRASGSQGLDRSERVFRWEEEPEPEEVVGEIMDDGSGTNTSEPSSKPEPEVVDAEWWDDNSQSGPWQDRFERARTFFYTRAQQRWEDRRADDQRRRETLLNKTDRSEAEEVFLLKDEMREAEGKYMESLRASDVVVPGFTEEERSAELDTMHGMYAHMMMQSCMRPLQGGLSPASVVQAASTMTAMYMLSPSFRDTVSEQLQPVKDAIQERIDTKAGQRMGWAESVANRENRIIDVRNARITEQNVRRERTGQTPKPLVEKVDPNEHLSKKWRKRYEDIQFRERGNREMFTERSAGLTEVSLLESAFEKMREPGADAEEITTNYRSMVANLYDQASDDGLAREDVAKASRVVLGERIQENPQLQAMVAGLAHGRVQMAPPQEQRQAGTDKVVKVWRGDFTDVHGRPVDLTRYNDPEMQAGAEGAFTMRQPMNMADHRTQMAQTMADSMAQSVENGDQKDFNAQLAAYMMGHRAQASDFDGENLPSPMPERLRTSRTMLASMTVDGIEPEDQRLAYSHAYVDAIEALQETYPEFAKQWGQTYGENWQDFMRDAVSDPEQAYQLWNQRQQNNQSGPQGSPPPRSQSEPGPQEADAEPEYA